ncbi:peroxiredoxin Q/BCP [Sinobacterium caligoides]|uniref:thioredoxin-dependent peroxiredoxin n=1 Tax=Sinobacterium caligoides TaxID=933926 RepID=A0A3N2DXQ3_9GAMM|nr:thioredoxin-dependent thiol peroxidase [Sinobacterium caligoides]ROS04640.1 peroxiredoxin Q/BCP [Sinobacterium caligoides]
MSFPKIGSAAHDFTLLDQNGSSISLSSLRGKTVVLYFYPRANTPGCTIQAEGIRDHLQSFEKLNTVVLGVSPDTVKKISNFTEKKSLNFTLLADENHEVAELYGVWQLKKFMGRESMGVVRTTFLIDAAGTVSGIIEVNGRKTGSKTKTHHEDVLAWLEENQ